MLVTTCNHCPYVIGWNPRLNAVAEEYAERGVRFLGIHANDADRYPADSIDHIRRLARGGGWPYPQLHDERQETARALGAEVTPHVFVLDGEQRLAYRGAPDGDHGDPSQNAAWLRAALDAVLAGRPVEQAGDAATRVQREVARLSAQSSASSSTITTSTNRIAPAAAGCHWLRQNPGFGPVARVVALRRRPDPVVVVTRHQPQPTPIRSSNPGAVTLRAGTRGRRDSRGAPFFPRAAAGRHTARRRTVRPAVGSTGR